MRPDSGSCGTFDRLWIRPVHNVMLDRCFHSDRKRETYGSRSMCRPSVSPPRSCCESLRAMTKSNPSFSCKTKNRSPRSGCRRWEVTGGTNSHLQLLPKPRSSRTHRLSGYPATRMAEQRSRPAGHFFSVYAQLDEAARAAYSDDGGIYPRRSSPRCSPRMRVEGHWG